MFEQCTYKTKQLPLTLEEADALVKHYSALELELLVALQDLDFKSFPAPSVVSNIQASVLANGITEAERKVLSKLSDRISTFIQQEFGINQLEKAGVEQQEQQQPQSSAKQNNKNKLFIRLSSRSPKDAVYLLDGGSLLLDKIRKSMHDRRHVTMCNYDDCTIEEMCVFGTCTHECMAVQTGAQALKLLMNSKRVHEDLLMAKLQMDKDWCMVCG